VRAAIAAAPDRVHACAHITGGGIVGNLARVLPASCDALLEQASWAVPRIFTEIALHGAVEPAEMARVFNLGLGMVLAVGADAVDDVRVALATAGQESSVVGEVVDGSGKVVLA